MELALWAEPDQVSLRPGRPTQVWRYRGEVLKGDPAALQTLPDSYLGPIIRARQGQKVRVHLTNNLAEPTIIHWHGLRVPPAADGHPKEAVQPGQTYTYEFEVRNRAGTYWFHPHPHGRTGPQVYQGLAGLFLVSDEVEAALALPQDAQDLPLVIQDRSFDANNQFVYMTNMMDQMMGVLGQEILVNGRPDFTLPAATRAYRLRLLNGSNSRIYKLAWQDGRPLIVIGTDGGLLTRPVSRDFVVLGPAERVELWADFSAETAGAELAMESLPFSGVEAGMMGMGGMDHGMHGGGSSGGEVPANGAPLRLFTVQIERSEPETLTLPDQLATVVPYSPETAVNQAAPRRFQLAMTNMNWTLNGRTFEMDGVSEAETVKLNTLEVWEFTNERPQEMMADFMAHPMHIHGVQFQILERTIDPGQAADWATIQPGYVDQGWKDTVLVMPGERVKLLLKFEDYEGLYLYHCHNLEHEDLGMMRNYLIQAL